MTLNDAISRLDELKPNSFSRGQKIYWLSALDGAVKKEIIDTHEGGEGICFAPYEERAGENPELLIPPPYDEVYHYYLCMKMHLAGREIAAYNNARMLFNNAYVTWQDYYNRVCTPLSQTVGFTL